VNWEGRNVLVTGGASFIGSHLVDALVARGASVRVVDNLSSGRLDNIKTQLDAGRVEFLKADLLEPGVAHEAVQGADVVFHLAADHGGRGYVDLHQAACATNLALDGMLFNACYRAAVGKVVFASSGCVYPNSLQTNPKEEVYLTEDLVGPPYEADNMYGWAKLMGELTLRAYYRDWGMKSACCRRKAMVAPRMRYAVGSPDGLRRTASIRGPSRSRRFFSKRVQMSRARVFRASPSTVQTFIGVSRTSRAYRAAFSGSPFPS